MYWVETIRGFGRRCLRCSSGSFVRMASNAQAKRALERLGPSLPIFLKKARAQPTVAGTNGSHNAPDDATSLGLIDDYDYSVRMPERCRRVKIEWA
jgi:hypothetical protein